MQIRVPFNSEESLLELALEKNIAIAHSCGGMGTCGTCRVEIRSDITQLPPRNEIELEMAKDRKFGSETRLACQLAPQPGLIARVCLVLEESES